VKHDFCILGHVPCSHLIDSEESHHHEICQAQLSYGIGHHDSVFEKSILSLHDNILLLNDINLSHAEFTKSNDDCNWVLN